MFQVLVNVALIIVLIIAISYFCLLGLLHLSDYMQSKRRAKREHKYDTLLNAAK